MYKSFIKYVPILDVIRLLTTLWHNTVYFVALCVDYSDIIMLLHLKIYVYCDRLSHLRMLHFVKSCGLFWKAFLKLCKKVLILTFKCLVRIQKSYRRRFILFRLLIRKWTCKEFLFRIIFSQFLQKLLLVKRAWIKRSFTPWFANFLL